MLADALIRPIRADAVDVPPDALALERWGRELGWARRPVAARAYLFRAGQSAHAIHLIHAGSFKSRVGSPDGREKIIGFRLRGDLLGLEAFAGPTYTSDAVALDLADVWVLPLARFDGEARRHPALRALVMASLARAMQRDWQWLLTLGTQHAEQRVVAFLLDVAERQRALGYSGRHLALRMTRADLGSFLAMKLETVTRILSRFAQLGIIEVHRHEVVVLRPDALQQRVAGVADATGAVAARVTARLPGAEASAVRPVRAVG